MKDVTAIWQRGAMNFIVLVMLSGIATTAHAQSDPEYMMEIGGGAGLTGYLGDFNGNLTKELQPQVSAVLRTLFNPYAGLKFSASWGKLTGSTKDVETFYPKLDDGTWIPEGDGRLHYEFSHTLVDAGCVFEYNFWPYGTGRDYRGAKRFTPFIFAGVGATYVSGGPKNVFTANVPMGVGVKYKLANRLNLGVEWGIHFSLSDELDGVKDPYNVKSSGAFKNTDCYSALLVTLTYSFKERCVTCWKE
jgi:hypothetical protein